MATVLMIAEGAGTGARHRWASAASGRFDGGLGLPQFPASGLSSWRAGLRATAVGAVAGAATGGIIGALTQAGVSEDEANVCAEESPVERL